MKLTTIILLLTVLMNLHASQSDQQKRRQKLSCSVTFTMFDPHFQQGDETYLDIDFNLTNKKAYLVLSKHAGDKWSLFQNKPITQWAVDSESSYQLVGWSESYLSMVYIGPKKWGAYLFIDEDLRKKRPDFARDYEFLCQEL